MDRSYHYAHRKGSEDERAVERKSSSRLEHRPRNHRRHRGQERDHEESNKYRHADRRDNAAFAKDERSTNDREEILHGEYFVSDKKGDIAILQFGSNDSYRVPSYRRIGYGHILGLSRFLKIDRERSTQSQVHLVSSDLRWTGRNKAIFAKVHKIEEYRIREIPEDVTNSFRRDYHSLKRNAEGCLQDSGQESDSGSGEDVMDYRSIHGKRQPNDLTDKDLELRQELKSNDREKQNSTEAASMRLVELEPTNLRAWLDLIQQKSGNLSTSQTYAERVSSADIKMSLYQKALKHITGQGKEVLLCGFMKEASLVLHRNKLLQKWLEILQQNRASFSLWIGYLDFMQSNPHSLRFDDLKEVYKDCLIALGELCHADTSKSSIQSSQKSASQIIYVFLRYTILMRQAGFIEQAIAIWQAIFEQQFYDGSSTEGKSQQSFEDFWESEVARIGEENALGWDHYDKQKHTTPPENSDPEAPPSESLTIQGWLNYEERMADLSPARTLDQADEADAFRVVLFSDIEPFLISVPKESHALVLDAFLMFCGLLPIGQQATRDWLCDSFLSHGKNTSFQKTNDTSADHPLAYHQSFGASSGCLLTIDVLLGQHAPLLHQSKINQRYPVKLDLILNVLRFVIRKGTIENSGRLVEYYLAFMLQHFPEQARKASKSLLKLHPQSLRLYNAHALVEFRLGNHDTAQKTLKTAMKMRPDDPCAILLRRTLVWELLEDGNAVNALENILNSSTSQTEESIFQTQRKLLARRDHAASSEDAPELTLAYVDCLMLLSYLTNPEPIEAALAIFESNSTFISSRYAGGEKQYLEMLHQQLARLLIYHMGHHQYKPSTIRKAVQKSLQLFPTNTMFLSLYQANEARFRINDRVRNVVQEILDKSGSSNAGNSSPLVGHLLAIHVESTRSLILGSSTESTRSVLERAVNDQATKHCPALWSLYIDFEMQNYSVRRGNQSRITNVLLRSIAACPWVRDFYLRAIRLYDEANTDKDSRVIYEMIVERELRLHMQLGQSAWT